MNRTKRKKKKDRLRGQKYFKKEITKLRDEVKQNNEVIKTLETNLENAKEVTKELQGRELEILQNKVKQQKEIMRKLNSELKNEDDLQQKLKQEAAISGLSSELQSERELENLNKN